MPEQLVLLRNSERSSYRRCRYKWRLAYIDRYASKINKPALGFGTMVHQALAAYYVPGTERGPLPATTFALLYDESPVAAQWDEDGSKIPARDLGISMLQGYVGTYGDEPNFLVISPEMSFAIDILDKNGSYLVTMVGTIDAVVYDVLLDRYYLLEHKTAKSVENVRINSGYGEQALTYWWAANVWLHHNGLMPEDHTIQGVLFNFLRKGMPDGRDVNEEGKALNKDGTVSKRQPKPLYVRQHFDLGHNLLEVAQRRVRFEAYEMNLVRQGKLPVYKNPTKDCSWDCQFRDVCSIHEMGGDWQTVLDLEFTSWDPYEGSEEAVDA